MSEELNSAFELLKQDFPVFELQNRRVIATQIELAGGDSVLAQPNATIKVKSEQFIQLPNLTYFKFVSPTIQDLVTYGVIQKGKKSESEPTPSPASADVGDSPESDKERADGNDLPPAALNESSPVPNVAIQNKPDTLPDSRPSHVTPTGGGTQKKSGK